MPFARPVAEYDAAASFPQPSPVSRMKILAVADRVARELVEPVHGGPGLTDIDLIVSCGDLPPEFLTELRARYDLPLLYVLGNHDLRYTASPPRGCRYIDRLLVTQNGLRILGFSGSRWYNGNINQYTEKEMAVLYPPTAPAPVAVWRGRPGGHPCASPTHPRRRGPVPQGIQELQRSYRPLQTGMSCARAHPYPVQR